MSETNLDGIESIQIVRADGHLTICGASQPPVAIDSSVEPHIKRDGGRAEISLRSHATIRLPAGVSVEVADCAGHLEVEDLATPLVLGRIAGNFQARRIGTLTIRSRIAGGARIEGAGAIDGGEVAGNLRVSNARSVSFSKVAGNFEGIDIELVAAIGRTGGDAFAERVGALRADAIGGKLYAERAGEIDVETVGGKARVIDATGAVRIRKVGGKLVILGAAGDVKVQSIGGHASIAGVSGAVELPEVGGALDLRGPFPAGKFWGAQSRGRISVELDAESSLDLTASTGWGRIRVFGLETANLKRADRNRAQGVIGAEKPEAERTRIALETRHADIIFARAGAHDRDYCWSGRGAHRGRRFPGAFDELGEILSEEFGEKIPAFVNSILGAAGQFVASSGAWSGGFLRSAAEDATRSVREGMAEAERAFGDLGEKLPRDIADSLEEFGRRLSEIIRRAATEGRGRTREGREETRDRVREAAREMRDSIRAAVREARSRGNDSGRDAATEAAGERPSATSSQTRPFTTAAHQGDVMDILNAVKEGRIQPAEADEMIAALMEVERATESRSREH
ncbi:MAG: hypothetical protein ACLQAT_12005 [Candidatus Binataceae bacterium]